MNYEIIGLTATLFVLLSFLMKRIELVRIINIIGAALFVVYGLGINALSTWLLNAILIVIHIVYLTIHLIKKKK
jgi:hypothetical protein